MRQDRRIDGPVLIISDHSDAHVPMVGRHLEEMGVSFAQFNTSDFPVRTRLSLSYNEESRSTLILPGNEAIDCSDIRSVWYRKPEPYGLSSAIPVAQHDFANAECREAVHGIYNSLRRKMWIDHPALMRHVSNKPLQLDIARQLGFVVPRTLITNDPLLAREFCKHCNGQVVYKTLSQPRISHADPQTGQQDSRIAVYTTLVSIEDADLWTSVQLAPCLFQEHVAKELELRVTVVGEEVFAAEILSQENPATVIDWRRGDLENLEHRIHHLPEKIADMCRSLLRTLGLNFGAIDLILTRDSQYVFLEINPNGQYGWIEYLTGLPISRAIARLLASPLQRSLQWEGGFI